MESKDFKSLFDDLAKANNFEKAFGGWFKESSECIAVLDLQKSNFGDYYELNIKIFVQEMFGKIHSKSKDLVKKEIGTVFTRQPKAFKDALDFDVPISDVKRKKRLEDLFKEFIVPFIDKALSREGLRELAQQEEIFLLPAVKQQLG